MEVEKSTFPTSHYTTKLHLLRLCGTGKKKKNRNKKKNQWNQTESPGINPHIYGYAFPTWLKWSLTASPFVELLFLFYML